MIEIVLEGEVPSKKNSRINTKTGRSFPSLRYTQWRDKNILYIRRYINGKIKEGEKAKLEVTFYHNTLHRRDSDNGLSSILDLLVDANIIPDDNWNVIPKIEIENKYNNRTNAFCDIKLYKLGE